VVECLPNKVKALSSNPVQVWHWVSDFLGCRGQTEPLLGRPIRPGVARYSSDDPPATFSYELSPFLAPFSPDGHRK
jgi:hypothetical protein